MVGNHNNGGDEEDGTSMLTTLEQQLAEEDGIHLDELSRDYHPMLGMVQVMLGYKPKLNGLVQIWSPGFRTFHLLFKHSTGMPFSMMPRRDGPLIQDLFVAMYAASRETGCEYCAAHTAAVAIRRGALPSRIVGRSRTTPEDDRVDGFPPEKDAKEDCDSWLSERDRALFAVARGLAALKGGKHSLRTQHLIELQKHYTPAEIEWIALSVSMMGCLNMLSSAFGIILEPEPFAESAPILTPTGWDAGIHAPPTRSGGTPENKGKASSASASRYRSRRRQVLNNSGGAQQQLERRRRDTGDFGCSRRRADEQRTNKDNLGFYLRLGRHCPQAMLIEHGWVAGVPSSWPKAGSYIQRHTGYSFSWLVQNCLTHSQAVVAYAAILRDHFDPKLSEIGILAKLLVSFVYATSAESHVLAREARSMALRLSQHEAERRRCSTADFVLDDNTLDELVDMVQDPLPQSEESCIARLDRLESLPGIDSRVTAAVLLLARAASTRPTVIPPLIVQEVGSLLSPAAKVETILWVGLQQCFCRMLRFAQVQERASKKLQQQEKLQRRRYKKAKKNKQSENQAELSETLECTSTTASSLTRRDGRNYRQARQSIDGGESSTFAADDSLSNHHHVLESMIFASERSRSGSSAPGGESPRLPAKAPCEKSCGSIPNNVPRGKGRKPPPSTMEVAC